MPATLSVYINEIHANLSVGRLKAGLDSRSPAGNSHGLGQKIRSRHVDRTEGTLEQIGNGAANQLAFFPTLSSVQWRDESAPTYQRPKAQIATRDVPATPKSEVNQLAPSNLSLIAACCPRLGPVITLANGSSISSTALAFSEGMPC